MSIRKNSIKPALLGFIIPFNLYLLPFLSPSPRLTDIVGVLMVFYILADISTNRRVNTKLVQRTAFLLVLLFPMLWFAMLAPGTSGKLQPVRWLIAVVWGVAICSYTRYNPNRTAFFKGLVAGASLCVIVPLMQTIGLLSFTKQVGLTARNVITDRYSQGGWRVPGMERHVNASAVIIGLSIPVTLGLISEDKVKPSRIILSMSVIALGSAVTLNRSSFIVSSILILVWVFLEKKDKIPVWSKASIVAFFVVAITWIGPPGGWERWKVLGRLESYGGLRIRILTAMESIRLISENPLGMGVQYTKALDMRTGYDATHNVFLKTALLGGLPLSLFMLIRLGALSSYLLRAGYVEGWLSLYIIGISFFEEYLSAPTILTLVVWLLLKPKTGKPYTNMRN